MRPTGVGDPGRRLPCLLVLGMLLWLGGCAERRGPEPPQPKASELEARFRARAETGSLRGNLRGRVAADVDGRFRVEVMDPLGRPVWVLAYDGSLLSAALPREGRWFRGEAPAELALDARRPIWRLLTGPDRWESSGPGGSVQVEVRDRRPRPVSPEGIFRVELPAVGLPEPLERVLGEPLLDLMMSLECPRD